MTMELRTAPRYFLVSGLAATVDGIDATVIDLSTRGARLQSTRPFTVGFSIPLTIHTTRGPIETKANVLWSRMAALALDEDESDRYLCGVAFEQPIPAVERVIDDLLDQSAAMLIADSRGVERYSVTTPMTAAFGPVSVRVLDLSVRGARLGTAKLATVGATAPLRFRIHGYESAVDVPATVVWSRLSDRKGRFECGVRIDGEEEWLRAVIDELSMRNEVQVDLYSMRRKFDPFVATPGLVALV